MATEKRLYGANYADDAKVGIPTVSSIIRYLVAVCFTAAQVARDFWQSDAGFELPRIAHDVCAIKNGIPFNSLGTIRLNCVASFLRSVEVVFHREAVGRVFVTDGKHVGARVFTKAFTTGYVGARKEIQ